MLNFTVAAAVMDKAPIQRLMNTKSVRVKFVQHEGKSDVRPHFARVNIDDKLTDHVVCMACKTL